MKKGANILRRILAMAFAVAFLASMLPTQLAAEAAGGASTGDVPFTTTGTEYIGTELTLTAATSGSGSEETGDYDNAGGSYLKTSDTAGDDTWQDDGEPVTYYPGWAWSSGNSDVNSAISAATAESVSFTVPETTSAITVTATYIKYLTHTETKVSSTQNSDGKYDVYMRNYTITTTWTGTYTFTPEYDELGSITLDYTRLTLDLVNNNHATLTPTLVGAHDGTVNPDTALTWESSDGNIASMDEDGVVTARGIGDATIKVHDGGGTIYATCDVTVSTVDRTVSGGDVTLTYGDDATQLEITFTPSPKADDTITWSSNDPSYVTVDQDGYVTPVSVGEATVTATVTGTGYNSTQATYNVTVEPKTLTVAMVDNTPITKESDGTNTVTSDNEDAIDRTLSLSVDTTPENGDDVKYYITDYGEYSGSGVSSSLTITVTVALTGDDAGNYTPSYTTITLNAEITAATPDKDELDLTDGATLSLSGSESITFTAPAYEDADGSLWFTAGNTLALNTASAASYTLYTDAACTSAFNGTLTEGAGSEQILYVKNASGVVYGPITVTYNYDASAPVATAVTTSDSVTAGAIDFASDDLTYTVTVSDSLSGVDGESIRYYISDSEDEEANPTWVTPDEVTPNSDGSFSFTVTAAASGYLHVKASDYTENESAEVVSKPMVIETNDPTVNVETNEIVTDAATTHSFTVTATDEADDGYYSGIASITLTLEGYDADGNAVSETVTETYDAPTDYANLEDAIKQTVDVTIPNYFSGVSSGEYTLFVTATDFCGNTCEAVPYAGIVIDQDAPTATLTMDGTTAYGDVDGDGTYYYNADNAGFTVTIDDYTIAQGVTYTITAADEDGNTVEKTGTATAKSDITFTADELADGLTDGTITVTVAVTDRADNATEALDYDETEGIEASVSGMEFTFVLDTTAPTLDGVELTEGSYYSSDSAVYYNGGFEAVYTITETNFYDDTAEGVVLDNASPTSDSTGTKGSKAILSIEDTTVTVSVASKDDVENSIYAPTVTVTDKAGNEMVLGDNAEATYGAVTVTDGEASLSTALVLDTLAPKLNSTASTSGGNYYSGDSAVYYNGGFTITYVITEVNYDESLADWSAEQTGDGSDAVLGYSRSSSAGTTTYTAAVASKSGVESASYAPALTVTDKAGNALEQDDDYDVSNEYDTATVSGGTATAENAFVLDTTAPVFTLSLTNRTDTDPDSDSYAYYNTNISAAFTVKDANLDGGKTAVATASNTSATTYDTATVSWVTMTLTKSDSSYSSNSWSQTLTASADGVYRFEVAAEDCAGNKLVQSDESSLAAYKTTTAHGSGQFWTSYYLVRDTVAPELEVTIKAGGSTFYNATLLTSGGYTVSQNNPYQPYSAATATLEKTDNSPTSVAYTFSSTTTNQTQSGSAYNHADLTVNLNGQQIFTISKLQITDRAGNVSAMSGETNKIYLDTEAPEVDEFAPTVAISGVTTAAVRGDAGTDLYDQDVTVRAVVVDPDSGVSSSGLYQVYYKVLVNGNDWTGQVTVNGTGNVTAAGTIGYGTSGSTYSSTAAVDETITSRDTILFTFDADTFNYNDVEIYVWAEDNSGNLLSEANAAYYHFGIDVTDPTITVRYDNNNAQNEKYFNADRIATITVTERNFDPNNTTVSTEAAATISGWTYTAGNAANGDDDTWTCTVTYSADGDYTFDVTTTDLVGHQAGEADYGDSVAPTEFTIDQTNPVISVVFDNNDVRNEKYYNAYRTATITIDEHNFSTDGVTVVTTAKLDGNAIAEPTAGAWSSSNDLNSAAVPFLTDGDYEMTVSFTDLAGNEAEVVVIEEFTVDTVEPELEINDLEDETAYSGDVAPWLEYSDINLEEESASITIVGYSNTTAKTLSGTYDDSAQHGTFTCDNLEVTQAMDDVYTATIRVSDLAGNVNEKVWTFSVNRYGSNFILSDETEALVEQYYTNEPQEVHVIEINVNETETQTVTANINGSVVTLALNEDYEVEDSGTGWHYYDYYVSADALSTEGSYDITFTSVDTAGNTNSNRAVKQDGETKDLPVKYVLDMTSPVNIITGVDDGSQYIAATRDIVLQCSDNVALDSISLSVYVNGECVDTKPGDELWDEDAEAWVYTAEARSDWQTVKLVSTDKAGNESTVNEVTFLLTKNLAVQYYNNKPIFFGSLILLLLILIFLFFILFKRRKKDEDEDAAGQAAGAAK